MGLGNIRFVLGDAEQLDIPRASFDRVLAVSALVTPETASRAARSVLADIDNLFQPLQPIEPPPISRDEFLLLVERLTSHFEQCASQAQGQAA